MAITARKHFGSLSNVTLGFIVLGEKGMYVSRGILCVEATAAGVPSFTFEIGEGGRLEPEVIAEGVRCIRNGLIGLGMIDGARVAAKANYVMRDFLGIRANAAVFSSHWRSSASELKRASSWPVPSISTVRTSKCLRHRRRACSFAPRRSPRSRRANEWQPWVCSRKRARGAMPGLGVFHLLRRTVGFDVGQSRGSKTSAARRTYETIHR